jgi:hypothetical protein
MRPQFSKRKVKPPGDPLLSAEQRTMILLDPHLRKHERKYSVKERFVSQFKGGNTRFIKKDNLQKMEDAS